MLAGRAKQRLVLRVTAQIWCQVVNYSSDGEQFRWKGCKCPLNRGHWVLIAYTWDRKNCPLYGIVGCPLFRGCLNIEVNGRTVGTFRIVRYIMGAHFSGVSTVQTSKLLIKKRPACLTCALQHASTARIGCFSVNHYSVWQIQQFYVWSHRPNTEYNIINHVATKHIYVGSI